MPAFCNAAAAGVLPLAATWMAPLREATRPSTLVTPCMLAETFTRLPSEHDLTLSLQGWGTGDRSEFTSSPPVVADLLGNGEMKIILAGDHEHTLSTANKGTEVWVLNRD